MVCPKCGQASSLASGRCPACGTALGQTSVGVLAIDTTGLPPGGTFGPSTGLPTSDDSDSVVTGAFDETTGTAATGGAPTATRHGPLRVGQGLGPRYHIIKLLGIGGMGAVYQA